MSPTTIRFRLGGLACVVLVAMAVAATTAVPVQAKRVLIVNGTETNYESFRGVISVRSEIGGCSGSFIDPEVVLTAAHCCRGAAVDSFYIQGGADILNDPIEYGGVIAVEHLTLPRDLCLLHLETPINVTDETLPYYDVKVEQPRTGETVYMVGYGLTSSFPEEGYGIHRMGRSTVRVASGAVISTGGGPSSACNGDSGGPLFAQEDGKWKVSGAASTADVRCAADGPNTYGSAPNDLEWINSVVEQYTGHSLLNEGDPGDFTPF